MADWREMTAIEQRAASAIAPGRVSYPVASPPKRLARSLSEQAGASPPQITDKQASAMWRLVQRFRRQIREQDILNEAGRMLGLVKPKDTP